MRVVVEVSAQTFTIPQECACCGEVPELHLAASYTRRTGKRVIRTSTQGVLFPYCKRCWTHAKRWTAAGRLAFTIGLGSTIVAAISAGPSRNDAAGLIMASGIFIWIAFFVLLRARARLTCTPTCAGPRPGVRHLGWVHSVSRFEFQSSRFAVKFANANVKKLINVSIPLRRLLEQTSMVPQTTPRSEPRTPPAPVVRPTPRPAPRSSQGDLVLQWIARIEGFKGSEARRNALKRALDEVSEAESRRELLLAASRIEVAAVLDKVDELSSVAAKKRHLAKAIADLRADALPDDLQVEQFQQLEQRLRELG